MYIDLFQIHEQQVLEQELKSLRKDAVSLEMIHLNCFYIWTNKQDLNKNIKNSYLNTNECIIIEKT